MVLRFSSNSILSARLRRLCPACAKHRCSGTTGWKPCGSRLGSIFRLGLSDPLLACARADPSAPDAAADFGSRLCPTLRHRPAGTLRLASKIHLPARPPMSFQPLPDFHRRLAPPVSIRDPLSPHLRNCIVSSNSPARAGLVALDRASVLNVRLTPSVALSGLTDGCISGLHRPSYPSVNPAIQFVSLLDHQLD